MDRSRPVILLVEDDHLRRTDYRALLESEGFDVVLADDGAAALERARSAAPDLVLTDVMLPRGSAFEIATTLKAEARTADVPIVAMTGQPIGAENDWTARAPWDAFLTKPCLPEELVACVKSLLYDRARRSSRGQRAASAVS